LAFLSDETVLAVKRAVEIYEVVSAYFPLKKAGSNYKACCPFHEEKTPSFNVHPEKQIYKCFGCGEAGDAISFVMKHENVEFVDAIKILAEKYAIPITYTDDGGPRGPSKEDLIRVCEWAAAIFRKQLETSGEGQKARDFLQRRGVTPETSETWRLGYSMESWDGLVNRARKAGIAEPLLLAAGLVKPRESGGVYDTFRGRVMFPIFDVRGKVVAFGARTLGDDQPKFLNSPETAAFSKGRTLFGLNAAKDAVEDTKTLYIVEGYLDVIIPHQAKVPGFVATLGTALTREHLKVLRRYADKVVLVYDADAAGQKASERGLDLLLAEDMDLFVAKLPAGEDPDDVVVKHGAEALRERVSKPQEMFEFLVSSLCDKIDASTPNGKTRVVEELMDRIAQIPSDVKREVLVQQVATRFAMPDHVLRERLKKAPAAAAGAVRIPVQPVKAPVEPGHPVGITLLSLLLHGPTSAAVRARLKAEQFPSETTRRIAAKAYAHLDAGRDLTGSDLVALMQEAALMQVAAEAAGRDVPADRANKMLDECVDYLSSQEYKAKAQAIHQGLKSASTEEQDRLLRELMKARQDRPTDQRLIPRA
jgi:DNA primase